jgi:predicted RecB family endonuclease
MEGDMKVVELREDYVDMAQDDYWDAVRQMNQAELIMELRRQQSRSANLLAECLSELSRMKKVVDGNAYA